MVDELLRRHDEVRRRYAKSEREFLLRLASVGQSPSALYIGCADSRVVPELLTASAPGDLFVVRNVANLVPPLAHADASVGAALEYAIGHLHVEHLVVCGHYGCGGVRAAIDGLDQAAAFPSLAEWLGGASTAVERVQAETHADANALWRRAVEENVLVQLENLLSFPVVEDALGRERLELHGWVYDLYALEVAVYDVSIDRFVRADIVMKRRVTLPP
jgi:carbonic anhydrase